MTPKEKSKELVDKYQDAGSKWYIETTKKYALIAVDEILNDDVYDMSETLFENRIIYWEEVRKEIELL